MPKGVYSAASAMVAEQRSLEAVARNLANIRTPGYRQEISLREGFAGILRDQGLTPPDRDSVQRDRGAGVREESRQHVFQDGERDPTAAPFDFALTGPGFFVVQDDNGQQFLTRAGHFTPDANGQLRTSEGYALVGQGGPLTVPADADKIIVDQAGRVSAQRQVGGIVTATVFDQVRLVAVEKPNEMVAKSGQYFAPGEQALTDTPMTKLHQGYLERANVDGVTMLVEMISVQRRHDAAQKAMTEQNGKGGQLGEILRT